MNIEPQFFQEIFKSVTTDAIASRINKGSKVFLEQSVTDFKVDVGNGNSLISAFVFDSKRKSVYKVSFQVRYFEENFINRFNLDYLDVRKDMNLNIADLCNFDDFYSNKLIEISNNNLEDFIYDVKCDCHEVKRKDYCFHYYAVLASLFAKIEFDVNLLWIIRGINKNLNLDDANIPISTSDSINDINSDQVFYGEKIPADLLKKIKKIDSKKPLLKDYQYSGFKENHTANTELLKSAFVDWLKKSY